MYHVLRTIDDNGRMLTHLPTADRFIGHGFEDYVRALTEAKAARTSLYRHKVTGEERAYSELSTTGAAFREDDDAVAAWRFVKASKLIGHRGYAIVVEDKDLPLYEPKGA